MSESKHSPLPWRWWRKKDGRPKKYDLAKLLSCNDDDIFTLYGGSGKKALGTTDQDIANAEFIVRAVNSHYAMLEALQDTQRVLASKGIDSSLIDNAIAKATGVTS